MNRTLATIVRAVAVGALLTASAPAASAAPAGCPDAFFVGVRGSGDAFDTRGGMGPSVEPVYEATRAALVGRAVEGIGLDYPAVDVHNVATDRALGRYLGSVERGAAGLERELSTLLNQCPVTPVVLAGHSQGAHVIDMFLAGNDSRGHPNLVGVSLLGDPTRSPTSPYNVAPNPPGPGIFYLGPLSYLLAGATPGPDFQGRIDGYCIHGDPICAGGPQRTLDPLTVPRIGPMFASRTHSSYAASGVSAAAGVRSAERLQAAFDATRPDSGTFGPYLANASILATGIASTGTGNGYWLVTNDGGVSTFGDAGVGGSMSGEPLNAPLVGMAPARDGRGYWLVAADGGVFSYVDAEFHGSLADETLVAPVVGMAATPSGEGYWLTAADGGVFAFGDAGFHGAMADQPLNAPVVGMAATPSGGGYWLTAADGGVFAFGDAGFHGAMADQPLNAPVVGMAATPSGEGYWLAAADGGVFALGDAEFHGSAVDRDVTAPVVGIAATPDGGGYWLTSTDGAVFGFGDAPLFEN